RREFTSFGWKRAQDFHSAEAVEEAVRQFVGALLEQLRWQRGVTGTVVQVLGGSLEQGDGAAQIDYFSACQMIAAQLHTLAEHLLAFLDAEAGLGCRRIRRSSASAWSTAGCAAAPSGSWGRRRGWIASGRGRRPGPRLTSCTGPWGKL